MNKWFKFLILGVVIGGLSFGNSYIAATNSPVTLVDTITASEWGAPPIPNWKIEDIVICENMTEAWVVAVGPGPFDDLLLFRITGISTDDVSVDKDSFLPFLDGILGGVFPAGMGPRGTPGLDINITCKVAYFGDYFLDTVNALDLEKAVEVKGGYPYSDLQQAIIYQTSVAPAPDDAQLTYPDNGRIIVTNSVSGVVTVLDADTGDILAEIDVGFAPISVPVVGKSWAWVAHIEGSDVACIDLTSYEVVAEVTGLGGAAFQAVTNGTADRLYVANQTLDSVSVYRAKGCNLSLIAEIPVGDGPRHLALSPDGKLLYVSNAIDKTVSVISTAKNKVVYTIRPLDLAGYVTELEPAPLGAVAVSKDGGHLFVFWEGGPKGTPGAFQLYYLDVSELYGSDYVDP